MMRILVYKTSLAWPRLSGHDVHTYEMIRSWIRLGANVSLVTSFSPKAQAVAGLELESRFSLNEICVIEENGAARNRSLPQRFTRYYGIPPSYVSEVARIARDIKANAVISVGLDALPILYKIKYAIRVWYAADEWFWHHLSLVKPYDSSSWKELKAAIVKGTYEWSFRKFIDRIWVVSTLDRRAMRIVTGIGNIDIIPNGVDSEYFTPSLSSDELQNSIAFWGRLDFEPNVQALKWFCRKVWPVLRSRHPDATFTILGAQPIHDVRKIGRLPGIQLLPDIDDLRPEIAPCQVVVLPFVSGGGIKNKLLEAAALGKPIVCSKSAAMGLSGTPPICMVRSVDQWLGTIENLWKNKKQRRALGSSAREWVCREHTWETAASKALNALQKHEQNQNPFIYEAC